MFGEVAQHKSQCSICINQQLKVSNIFLCSCCFWPTATYYNAVLHINIKNKDVTTKVVLVAQSF